MILEYFYYLMEEATEPKTIKISKETC